MEETLTTDDETTAADVAGAAAADGAVAVEEVSLDAKARALGGASSWRTHPLDELGLPVIKFSDGPNGVRGEAESDGQVAGIVIPVGIALGATWNPALAERLGGLLGTETIRKGAHVLLAPTVNLQRTPVGGRVFECFSEDPELTARLTVGFVRGVQAKDVGVTVKHFVANDTEVDRETVDVRVDQGVLRELYLRPFEAAVREAGAWGIMSAYNRLYGEYCAENRWLLTELLRKEWGFDGFVVSDWDGAHDTAGAIGAGLTVAMPGPRTIYGKRLEDVVRDGDASEEDVDAMVLEMVRLADRTHAAELSADRPQTSVDDPAERELCRQAAIESIVLLENPAGVLPLAEDVTVAVIGPNAVDTRIMGGGSSSLTPLPHRSILESLQDRLGQRVVADARGCRIDKLAPKLTADELRRADGSPGLDVAYTNDADGSGPIVATTRTDSSTMLSFGTVPEGVNDDGQFTITLTGTFVASVSGPHRFGASIAGKGTVTVGDVTVLDDPDRTLPRGEWMFGYACEEQHAVVDLVAGEAVPIVVRSSGVRGFAVMTLGCEPPEEVPLMEAAVAAAGAADVAIVVVGTTDEWESEGVDRSTLALPGAQDELVRSVAAVAPSTVVVVNSGGPVDMPWADEVDAIVWASFCGIETGPAVAAVLSGDSDAGGRLPITYPKRSEDCPAWPHYMPEAGVQTYGEGRFMGYRGHDASGIAPRWPFGHVRSYGESDWVAARAVETGAASGAGGPTGACGADPAGPAVRFEVDIEVTGTRSATDVVQVYVAPVGDGRPPKSLVGFTKIVTAAGGGSTAVVDVMPEALREWDDDAEAWTNPGGVRRFILAASAADVRFELDVDVDG